MQPAVVDVSVKWDLPKGVSATVLSPPITSIFQGQRSLLFAQLTGQVLTCFQLKTMHLFLIKRPTTVVPVYFRVQTQQRAV